MPRLVTRRHFVRCLLAGTSSAGWTGCGTVLHPERRGQAAGRLDWKIVALDAVGLLFFFIPGVIAFAVDFNNGSIYLPSGSYGKLPQAADDKKLVAHKLDKGAMTQHDLERIVSAKINREVRLTPGAYKSQEIEKLDDFWSTHDELAQR